MLQLQDTTTVDQQQHQQQQTPAAAALSAAALSSLNALKHGATAKCLFIQDENPAEFYELLDDAFAQYQPSSKNDAGMVYDFVEARWYLTRHQRIYAEHEFELHQDHPLSNHWFKDDLDKLNLFDRYQTTAERRFRRALINVQSIRKIAVSEQHWQQQLALQKQRVDLEVQKFEHRKELANRPRGEKKKEEAPPQASAPEPWSPVQSGPECDNRCLIVQSVLITVKDGAPCMEQHEPSNDEVRQIIANRHTYPEPPVLVARHFGFFRTLPAEYEFVLQGGPVPRPVDDWIDIQYEMSFDEWLLLAEKEDYIYTNSADNNDDDEDEDDDDNE